MSLLFLASFSACSSAQKVQRDPEYVSAITQRSAKIINTLDITDSALYHKVHDAVRDQYFNLNDIHESYDADKASIKKSDITKEEKEAREAKAVEKKKTALMQLHAKYIAHLNRLLSPAQVEKVKDGMTYGVLPLTWGAYLDMLQNLTPAQKEQMYSWLVEARELAMDEGSSDAKHAVFGKYKGKINNYLSAAGYDMKKEGEEWQKRIKEQKAQTSN